MGSRFFYTNTKQQGRVFQQSKVFGDRVEMQNDINRRMAMRGKDLDNVKAYEIRELKMSVGVVIGGAK